MIQRTLWQNGQTYLQAKLNSQKAKYILCIVNITKDSICKESICISSVITSICRST